jgi:hypothetical protein
MATKLGVACSALATIAALVAAILKGNHQPETIAALIAAVAPIYAVIRGRMDQAVAHVRAAPGGVLSDPGAQKLHADMTAAYSGSSSVARSFSPMDDMGDDGDTALPAELETFEPADPAHIPSDEVDTPHGTVEP